MNISGCITSIDQDGSKECRDFRALHFGISGLRKAHTVAGYMLHTRSDVAKSYKEVDVMISRDNMLARRVRTSLSANLLICS
jgi:hypothetical protein